MTAETPVVFVHGLWIHASAWAPWTELFRSAGYRPLAPGWPGDGETVEQTRADPAPLAGVGLDAVVAHYGEIITGLDQPPVVVGHSVGGLVTQLLNDRYRLRAAVAIDPAPIKGVRPVPLAQLRSSFPVLRNPANVRRTVALSAAQFRYGFGNAVPAAESDELYARYAIPGPGRPIVEVATANLRRGSPAAVDTRKGDRAPLLMMAGELDHTVPAVGVRAAHRLYAGSSAVADLVEFPGRAHSLVLDHGWSDVADAALSWLDKQLTAAG